jgi:hypothetical protein
MDWPQQPKKEMQKATERKRLLLKGIIKEHGS